MRTNGKPKTEANEWHDCTITNHGISNLYKMLNDQIERKHAHEPTSLLAVVFSEDAKKKENAKLSSIR